MKRGLGFILFLALANFSRASDPSKAQSYLVYCSACHGQRMEGGRATPLVKNSWKYGGSRDSIIKTIRNGIPGTQMMKWDGLLSAKDVEAIADYILDAQKKRASDRKPESHESVRHAHGK